MENQEQHVILFPFMAQGHIIPFLALAQILQHKGCSITLINTPHNIKNLQQSLPQGSTNIKLHSIPFNSSDHGLPPDVENTDSLSYSLICRFVEATPSLKPHFENIVHELIHLHNGEKPVCIVSDFFFGWTADVAHALGIPHAIFNAGGGFGMACYYTVWLNLPHKISSAAEGCEFDLPDFPEAGKLHVSQLTPAMLVAGEHDSMTRFMAKCLSLWSSSDAILINTVQRIDELGLTYFRRKLGIQVHAIGPIILSGGYRARTDTRAAKAIEIIEWLDKKETCTVLYVSFGSQNTISAPQMMKLARALESSGCSFVWVVRPPFGFDINAEFIPEDWLPERFIDRVGDRGLVVEKWAPQVEILAHRSVGGFLTHCGWNSVFEALENGVSMLSWPMSAEQFYNAKFLVEVAGVSVEVARGTSFEVREEDIVEKVGMVMGGSEKGLEIRRRAREIKDIVRDAVRDEEGYKGSSVRALDEFLINAAARLNLNSPPS